MPLNSISKRKAILKICIAAITCIFIWNLIIIFFIEKVPVRIYDEKIGSYYQPGSTYVNGTEGFTKISIDNHGFNNDNFELGKKKPRVIVLGDSHTESFQVKRRENFVYLLGELNKENYEVLNLGISGNSIADYIGIIDGINKKFNPDKIIIQITSHDFTVDSLSKHKHFYIEKNDHFKLIHNKNLINSLSYKIKSILRSKIFIPTITVHSLKRAQEFIGKKNNSTSIKDNTSIEEKYGELIEWQISQLFNKNSSITFLYLPETPTISSSSFEKPDLVKEIIYKESQKLGIPFIDMTQDFNYLYEKNYKLPRGFNNTRPGVGHLNIEGHKAVAFKLNKYIKNNWRIF